MTFFPFFSKLCKVAKACKPGTWAYGGGKQAYSAGPRAHQVQKHEARLGLAAGVEITAVRLNALTKE